MKGDECTLFSLGVIFFFPLEIIGKMGYI